jgi:hypothetical protein
MNTKTLNASAFNSPGIAGTDIGADEVLLRIGGVRFLPWLAPEILQLVDGIQERSVLTFTLKDGPTHAQPIISPPRPGQMVTLNIGPTRVFGGTVDSVEETRLGMRADAIEYRVTCTDWCAICDRRRCARSFVEKTVAYIINDLHAQYLVDEGITLGTISGATALIHEAVLDYITITEALDQLALRTGCHWYITPYKQLMFVERTEFAAPWELTATANVANVVVRRHREDYRNQQYISGARAETTEQRESFVADGEQRTFNVGYPIMYTPTVTLNGITETVGIRGVDSGLRWYWAADDDSVTRDSSAFDLAEGDVVEVTYIGAVDIMLRSRDEDEITERAAAEGGTGIYDNVYSLSGLYPFATILDTATDLLRRYGEIGATITFDTYTTGLEAGQLLTANLPEHDIDTTLLIVRVTLQELVPGTYSWHVEAVDGEAIGGWVQWFREMLGGPTMDRLFENSTDVLAVALPTFTKEWLETDTPNPFAIKLAPSTTLAPDTDLKPSFAVNDEIKYLAIYNGETHEVARVQVTAWTIRTDTELTTLSIISQTDYVGTITHFGWYGGDSATSAVTTGLLMDKQTYNYDKTGLEALLVTHQNTKGWT